MVRNNVLDSRILKIFTEDSSDLSRRRKFYANFLSLIDRFSRWKLKT